MAKYDETRELALANFELLLKLWGIEYVQVTPYEFDFKNPLRQDRNYGACRFNVQKGIGKDFAAAGFDRSAAQIVGVDLDEDDVLGFSSDNLIATNRVFDVIGLRQRLHRDISYSVAADRLKENLKSLEETPGYETVSREAVRKRRKEFEDRRQHSIQVANLLWQEAHPIKGSLGEKYILSRCMDIDVTKEPNIGFHKVHNAAVGRFVPTLLFRVTETYNSKEHKAVHRIYLNNEGKKLDVAEPKMALGPIMGSAIWFGKPDTILAIAEGPESALSLRAVFPFVASTINAQNFHRLTIPSIVKTIMLYPDTDTAGEAAFEMAYEAYNKLPKVKVLRGTYD